MNVKEFIDDIRKELATSPEISEYEDIKSFVEFKAMRDSRFNGCSLKSIEEIVNRTMYSIKSDVSILKPYIDDKRVSEIMVNGYKNIFIEKEGKIFKVNDTFFDTDELEEVIRRIAGKVHREINELNPIVDARLDDGSRVNGVYKNIALAGPVLTIRKFPTNTVTMDDLINWDSITGEAVDFLHELMINGFNFFISGGTSSGKTTFLKCYVGAYSKRRKSYSY